jgi:hypothetical protein
MSEIRRDLSHHETPHAQKQSAAATPHLGSAGDKAKKVVDMAKRLKAQNWGGAYQQNQCANFVRKVFTDSGFHLAVVANPTDAALVRKQGLGFGPTLADSFAGEEVGPKVDWHQAQPGDIIMFKGTDPSYTYGTITHVGICIGNGLMIDRGTHGMHEQPLTGYGAGNIVEVRRPRVLGGGGGAAVTAAAHGHSVKVFVHDGKVGGSVNGASLPIRLEVSLRVMGGQLHAYVDGREVRVKGLSLEMFM